MILGLAGLARIAARFDLPTVPLYLLAGLAFGEGGVLPLVTTRAFVETGAEIGLILVLFVLGLEHSSRDLVATAKASAAPGAVDLILNVTPGVVASPSGGDRSQRRSSVASRTSRPQASRRSFSSTPGRMPVVPAGSWSRSPSSRTS